MEKHRDIINFVVGILFVAGLVFGAQYLKTSENEEEVIAGDETPEEAADETLSFLDNVEGQLVCYSVEEESDYKINIAYGYTFTDDIAVSANVYTEIVYSSEDFYNIALLTTESEEELYNSIEGITGTTTGVNMAVTSNYTYDLTSLNFPLELEYDEYTTLTIEMITGTSEEILSGITNSEYYNGYICVER